MTYRLLTSVPSIRSQHRVAKLRIGDCEEPLPSMRKLARRSRTEHGVIGLVLARISHRDLRNDRPQEVRQMS